MSPTPRTVLSSPPGQEDQSARLAASAEVDQVVDTPTLEQFQRWLENAAHAAHHAYENPSDGISSSSADLRLHHLGCEMAIAECRVATRVLMSFKAEHYK